MAVQRTTIVLPLALKNAAAAAARARGISFAELLRRALAQELSGDGSGAKRRRGDPFWDDVAVYRGRGPKDYALNHDKYLYGE